MGDLSICGKLQAVGVLMLLLIALDSAAGYCSQGSEWIEYNGHCYRWTRLPTTNWFRAELNCGQAGGHLVSVPTAQDNSFLQKLTQCKNHFWIGLVNTVPSLRANAQSYEWWDGTTRNYTSPLSLTNSDYMDCVFFHSNGNWYNNLHCQTLLGYVCKAQATQGSPDETPAPAEQRNSGTTVAALGTRLEFQSPTNDTCPPKWVQLDRSCYFVSDNKTNYFNAQMSCQALGGNVASVLTLREHTLLTVALGCHSPVWIGLEKARPCFKQPNQGHCWVWMDRSPVNYFEWTPNQSLDRRDAECVILDGQWTVTNCFQEYRYVCKKPL